MTHTENSKLSSEIRVGYVTTHWEEFNSTLLTAPHIAGEHLGREGQVVAVPFDYLHPENFDLVVSIGMPLPESLNKCCVYIDPEELSALNEAARNEFVANAIAKAVCLLSLQVLSAPQV